MIGGRSAGYLTHREYLARLEWLDMQRDNPSDTLGVLVAYLMQIALEVKRVLAKRPKLIKLENFVLRWRKSKPKTPKSPQEAARESKSRWRQALSGAVNARQKSREANIRSRQRKPQNNDQDS